MVKKFFLMPGGVVALNNGKNINQAVKFIDFLFQLKAKKFYYALQATKCRFPEHYSTRPNRTSSTHGLYPAKQNTKL